MPCLTGPQTGVFRDVIPEGMPEQVRMDVGRDAALSETVPTVRQIACGLLGVLGYSFQRVTPVAQPL